MVAGAGGLIALMTNVATIVGKIGPEFQSIGQIANKVWEAIKGFVNKHFIILQNYNYNFNLFNISILALSVFCSIGLIFS